MTAHWSVDDLPWHTLDPSLVDRELLETVKTAALVEANSADYVTYLHNVFADDPEFKQAATVWGAEERQHGEALGRWAEAVDPSFKFAASLAHFRAGYRLPLGVEHSVRGSQTGELVARCVVESGTCSFYSALRDNALEPLLKQICGYIAQDEARHYRLFHDHLQRHARKHPLSLRVRLGIAIGRVIETDDDELAYAYYSANIALDQTRARTYDRAKFARAYWRRAMQMYGFKHLRTAAHMMLRATGIAPNGCLPRLGISIGWQLVQWRTHRLQRQLSD